jgi:hypothetical protein
MLDHLQATHAAIELLESTDHTAAWLATLGRLIDQPNVHGLLRGRTARLLLDAGQLKPEDAARHMSLMLSPGTDAWQAAMWIDGFLSGSGLVLVHDLKLLKVVDQWVAGISKEKFEELVPMLRRTFSVFPKPERRQIGQTLTQAADQSGQTSVSLTDVDEIRANRVLPLLVQILGGKVQ